MREGVAALLPLGLSAGALMLLAATGLSLLLLDGR